MRHRAISVTPDRQQVVDFTNLYYIGNSAAIASDPFTETLRAATDFTGLKVGVERGTTYQIWAQDTLVDGGIIAAGRPAHLLDAERNHSRPAQRHASTWVSWAS